MLKTTALAPLLLLLAPLPALAGTVAEVDQAITDNLGDPPAFHAAFEAIQKAVVADDPAALAPWVQFPINVRIGNKAVAIKDADMFVADYPTVFSTAIKAAITNQKFEDLFVSYEGVMFGDGQLWINGICKTDACEQVDVRIITIQEAK